REDLPRFIACGLIGHALHVGIVFWGISLSTAFSSALVLTSGPLFTLAILVLLGAEQLRASQVAGTLVAMAGIAIFLSDKFAGGVLPALRGDHALPGGRLAGVGLGQPCPRHRALGAAHVPAAADRGSRRLAHARRAVHLAEDRRGRRYHGGGRLGAVRRRASAA